MDFVKAGSQYINLNLITHVYSQVEIRPKATIVFSGSVSSVQLFDDDATTFLAIMGKIAAANWYVDVPDEDNEDGEPLEFHEGADNWPLPF